MVGAGGESSPRAMALDALELSDGVADLHAFDESGDAAEISLATAHHFKAGDRIAIIADPHFAGTDVFRMEDESLFHEGLLAAAAATFAAAIVRIAIAIDDRTKDESAGIGRVGFIGIDVPE